MDRRFFVAWVVVFVVWMAGSFVVHGALLQPMPGTLVAKQIVFDGILLLVLGAAAAFCYRGEGRA